MTASIPVQPIKLYRHPLSGHSHRVQLFLSILGLPHQIIDVDLARGAQKQPEFLRLNPFGQVPVIDDDGMVLADSNAILVYLATRYGDATWLPPDPAGASAVQRWLSVAAGQIAAGPANARLATVFGAGIDASDAIRRSHALLVVMEGVLRPSRYLTGDRPTIADLACYAYVAHAPEGNVALTDYAGVRAWLARIEALPGFVPMRKTDVGLAA